MKRFFTVLFTSLNPAYLVRQYVFALFIALFFFFISPENMRSTLPFLLISFLLYPFAMFVYDSLVALIIGDRVWFTSWLFTFIWALIKILGIFVFSVFIAPLGILYLYFTHKNE